jgi:hypothetical protein
METKRASLPLIRPPQSTDYARRCAYFCERTDRPPGNSHRTDRHTLYTVQVRVRVILQVCRFAPVLIHQPKEAPRVGFRLIRSERYDRSRDTPLSAGNQPLSLLWPITALCPMANEQGSRDPHLLVPIIESDNFLAGFSLCSGRWQ